MFRRMACALMCLLLIGVSTLAEEPTMEERLGDGFVIGTGTSTGGMFDGTPLEGSNLPGA